MEAGKVPERRPQRAGQTTLSPRGRVSCLYFPETCHPHKVRCLGTDELGTV